MGSSGKTVQLPIHPVNSMATLVQQFGYSVILFSLLIHPSQCHVTDSTIMQDDKEIIWCAVSAILTQGFHSLK
jgi:hypothetical protein